MLNRLFFPLPLFAFAALTTLGSPFFAAAAAASDKVKIHLNWKAEPEFGGFYEAKRLGLFEKAGFEVDLIEGGAGAPVVQMIASGAAEFGIVAGDEVIISQDRGSDVTALYAVYQKSPQGIMVHEERGFKTLQEVLKTEGTLSIQTGAAFTLFLQKKFKNQFNVKLVPYQGGIAPFLQDSRFSQQCFVTSEPLAAIKKGAKVKSFVIADVGFQPYSAVLATRKATLQKDRARVARLVDAIREGWQSYLKNPAPTNALMQKLNPSLDLETFAAIAKQEVPFIEGTETKKKGLGSMTATRWGDLSLQLKEIGLVKNARPGLEFFSAL